MPWLQLRIDSRGEQAEIIEETLMASEALAVTLSDNADEPILEPELGQTPLWHATRVTGLFDAQTNTDQVLETLHKHIDLSHSHTRWEILEDKDWQREWLKHYQPIQCAENLWVCPSDLTPPAPDALNVILDPGLAFGTGTHPTTFLCLRWLAQQALNGKSLIDFGCGSGILGIAALKLGAEKVTGIDIDPQALLATQDNTRRNALDSARLPVFFPDKCPDEQVHIVVANILAGPLISLRDTIVSLLTPQGQLCLSGILEEQTEEIVSAYDKKVHIDKVDKKDGWVCISATFKG